MRDKKNGEEGRREEGRRKGGERKEFSSRKMNGEAFIGRLRLF